MQYPVILSRISDLPQPFLRGDSNYLAWQAAQTMALANYCLQADSLSSQVIFAMASGGWLTVWGELLGFQRFPAEGDSVYRSRVSDSLVAPVGSPLAIQSFASSFFGSTVIVTETPPGYTIQIPSFATSGQIHNFLVGLARIRPAGVPVFINQIFQSFYFNTYNYWQGLNIAGPYFGGLSSEVPWPLGPNTNNSQPLLPSLILSDPILNGQTLIAG